MPSGVEHPTAVEDVFIDHFAHIGLTDPKALFEPPFTDGHDQGILGVLPHLAKDIVAVIRRVNQNALTT